MPDLDVRMALYRRLSEPRTGQAIEAFAAEMIDRFGPLPRADGNLSSSSRSSTAAARRWSPRSTSAPKGAVVTFHEDGFPDPGGLIAYVERLEGHRQAAPRQQDDSVNRAWPTPDARLNGALQRARGPRAGRCRRRRGEEGARAGSGPLHELIGELARVAADRLVEHRYVERVGRVIQDLAFAREAEACSFDDLADGGRVDPVQGLSVSLSPRPGLAI